MASPYSVLPDANDPWLALQEMEQRLSWQKWAHENGWRINRLWKKFTGVELSMDELKLVASSGEGAAPYMEKLQAFAYYEPFYEEYRKLYGAEPPKELYMQGGAYKKAWGQEKEFGSPEEYTTWEQAGIKTKAALPEIADLMQTELGRGVGQGQVQEYFAGYATSGDFTRQLEDARTRRKYRWAQSQSSAGYGKGEAGLKLAEWQNY